MPSEKAMQLIRKWGYDGEAELGNLIDAHTAEALADAMRGLDEATEALTEISKRVPDYGHEGVGTVARSALDAITKLKGKQG